MLPGVKGANANHNFVTAPAELENVAQTPVNSEKQSRHSRLQDMKQFLASFNQQQEATNLDLSNHIAGRRWPGRSGDGSLAESWTGIGLCQLPASTPAQSRVSIVYKLQVYSASYNVTCYVRFMDDRS